MNKTKENKMLKYFELLGGGMSGVMVDNVLKNLFVVEFKVIATGKVFRVTGDKAERLLRRLS